MGARKMAVGKKGEGLHIGRGFNTRKTHEGVGKPKEWEGADGGGRTSSGKGKYSEQERRAKTKTHDRCRGQWPGGVGGGFDGGGEEFGSGRTDWRGKKIRTRVGKLEKLRARKKG